MRFSPLLVCVAIVFTIEPRAAHEFPNCHHLTDNSCWHAMNHTNGRASISCRMSGLNATFWAKELQPNKLFSYQFCSGLGDGLGYAAGKVSCEIDREGRKSAIRFTTNSMGDSIMIEIGNSETKVMRRQGGRESRISLDK
jgi:hypothetical protein